MTTAPLVTVLMAVHNGADYVGTAIASILAQTFTDFEFVIVDDGSTDETPLRIASFGDPRIRVVRNEGNVGLTRSLNRGLAMARGTFVARQDADDVSHGERLAGQVAFFMREPDVVVLGTQAGYIDARGRSTAVAPWPKSTSDMGIRWQLLFDGPFVHASVMFRKAVVWDELGGYDESFITSQDFELWSRISARGYAMRNLPETLIDFRVHDGSVTTRHRAEGAAKLRAVFLGTLVRQLGADAVPAGWPDTWISVNYPRLFPGADDAVSTVMRAIDSIHRRFSQVYPAAANDREIRRHRAAMLIRLANHAAHHRRLDSIAPFLQACWLDPVMSVRTATSYVRHLSK